MKEMVDKNKILELVTGSFLYGTNLPTSDKDETGLFIADKEYYLGLNTVNEVDLNSFSVNIIPFTWSNTNFKNYVVNTNVNIEIDVLARYLNRLNEIKQKRII